MDEMYIKMCREAKEIQEKWEPKPANKVVLIRLRGNPYDIKGSYHVDHLDKDAKKWSVEELNNEGIFWLPRQEDLQNIILDGFKGEHENYKPTPIMILKTFARDFVNHFGNDLDDRRTLDELWLCFVMELVYNKQWNKETQTWETTQ